MSSNFRITFALNPWCPRWIKFTSWYRQPSGIGGCPILSLQMRQKYKFATVGNKGLQSSCLGGITVPRQWKIWSWWWGLHPQDVMIPSSNWVLNFRRELTNIPYPDLPFGTFESMIFRTSRLVGFLLVFVCFWVALIPTHPQICPNPHFQAKPPVSAVEASLRFGSAKCTVPPRGFCWSTARGALFLELLRCPRKRNVSGRQLRIWVSWSCNSCLRTFKRSEA